MDKTRDTYKERIKKHFKETYNKTYDFTEIEEILGKDLAYESGSLSAFFNREVGTLNDTQKNSMIFRAAYHYLKHGIPPSVFDIKPEEIFSGKQKECSSEVIDIQKLQSNTEGLNVLYPQTLKKYILQAKKEIWVYDYFTKEADKAASFKKAHDEHYKAIEEQLKINEKLEYHRLLAFSYAPDKKDSIEKASIIELIVKQCSDIFFEHIIRCFTYYPNERLFHKHTVKSEKA